MILANLSSMLISHPAVLLYRYSPLLCDIGINQLFNLVNIFSVVYCSVITRVSVNHALWFSTQAAISLERKVEYAQGTSTKSVSLFTLPCGALSRPAL